MQTIGEKVIETVTSGLFSVSYPDPDEAHVFVWSSGAAEQIEAAIHDYQSVGRKYDAMLVSNLHVTIRAALVRLQAPDNVKAMHEDGHLESVLEWIKSA